MKPYKPAFYGPSDPLYGVQCASIADAMTKLVLTAVGDGTIRSSVRPSAHSSASPRQPVMVTQLPVRRQVTEPEAQLN